MKGVVLLLAATTAHADTPSTRATAVELDREDAPAGRVELGFDGGAPLAGWGASIGAGLLAKPLTLATSDGVSAPVAYRETVVLGAALAIGKSVVVDARLPLLRQTAPARYAIGDLRLAARIRIAGDDAHAVFLRGAVTLPTGDDGDYAGDLHWGAQWNLIGRYALGPVTLAASAGIHIRSAEVAIGDRVVGDEAIGAIGAIVELGAPGCIPLALTAELDGALADKSSDLRGPSPLEARGGLVARFPLFTLGVRAGAGLDDQIGSPAWRATLELAIHGDWNPWTPSTTRAAELDDEGD